jgi:hypothetical protein
VKFFSFGHKIGVKYEFTWGHEDRVVEPVVGVEFTSSFESRMYVGNSLLLHGYVT